jgi:F0F1-type ATP synthase assembly protein I
MPWTLLVTLIPELVRGVIAIVREHIAQQKAEAEAREAEAERDRDMVHSRETKTP